MTVLAFLTVSSATTLGAAELLWRWSPVAERFRWSLGWVAARWLGVGAAVMLSARLLL